jgi:uncharacterized protein YggE
MRRWLLAILSVVVLAVLAAPARAQDERSIRVSGSAFRLAANDTARVGFGVRVRARNAAGALRAASARARRVNAALTSRGVAAADLRTTAVSLSRVLVRRRGAAPRTAGYSAAVSVRAVVRAVGRTGLLIGAGVAAGATGVSGPEFFVSDPEEIYRQALIAAFDRARAKAQRLATRAGVTLGAPLRIVEGGLDVETPAGQEVQSPRSGTAPVTSVPVRPGRSRVDASVDVTFAVS